MEVTLKDLDKVVKGCEHGLPLFKIVEQPFFMSLITLAREALFHRQQPPQQEKSTEIESATKCFEAVVAAIQLIQKEQKVSDPWISVKKRKPLDHRLVFMYSQESNEYGHGHFDHIGIEVSHWQPLVPPKEVDWLGPDNESEFCGWVNKGYITQRKGD